MPLTPRCTIHIARLRSAHPIVALAGLKVVDGSSHLPRIGLDLVALTCPPLESPGDPDRRVRGSSHFSSRTLPDLRRRSGCGTSSTASRRRARTTTFTLGEVRASIWEVFRGHGHTALLARERWRAIASLTTSMLRMSIAWCHDRCSDGCRRPSGRRRLLEPLDFPPAFREIVLVADDASRTLAFVLQILAKRRTGGPRPLERRERLALPPRRSRVSRARRLVGLLRTFAAGAPRWTEHEAGPTGSATRRFAPCIPPEHSPAAKAPERDSCLSGSTECSHR